MPITKTEKTTKVTKTTTTTRKRRKKTPELKLMEIRLNISSELEEFSLNLENFLNSILDKYKRKYESSLLILNSVNKTDTEVCNEIIDYIQESSSHLKIRVEDEEYMDKNRISVVDILIYLTTEDITEGVLVHKETKLTIVKIKGDQLWVC